jgi:hypothetical protein
MVPASAGRAATTSLRVYPVSATWRWMAWRSRCGCGSHTRTDDDVENLADRYALDAEAVVPKLSIGPEAAA